MLTDQAASPPAWSLKAHDQACRSREFAIAAEAFMGIAG